MEIRTVSSSSTVMPWVSDDFLASDFVIDFKSTKFHRYLFIYWNVTIS